MTRRSRLVLAAAIGLITVLAVGWVAWQQLGGPPSIVVSRSPLIGKPAPPLSLPALDGGTITLADYAGRPLIVNFWASDCLPCRQEFPLFKSARAEHAAEGLEVVTHDDSFGAARQFAWKRDLAAGVDSDDSAWTASRRRCCCQRPSTLIGRASCARSATDPTGGTLEGSWPRSSDSFVTNADTPLVGQPHVRWFTSAYLSPASDEKRDRQVRSTEPVSDENDTEGHFAADARYDTRSRADQSARWSGRRASAAREPRQKAAPSLPAGEGDRRRRQRARVIGATSAGGWPWADGQIERPEAGPRGPSRRNTWLRGTDSNRRPTGYRPMTAAAPPRDFLFE